MQHIRMALLSLAAITILAGRSFGSAIVYTDRASFEAAIGPHVTYTFDADDSFPAAPTNMSSFSGFEAYSGDSPYSAALRAYPNGSNNQTLSGEYNDFLTSSLLISFDAPQYSLGFDDYLDGYGGLIFINLQGSQSNYLLSGFADPAFFGLTSSEPILGFSVKSQGDSRSQRYKGIDNFTIVPEPSATDIFILLSAFLFRRKRTIRRRSRRTSSSSCAAIEGLECIASLGIGESGLRS